MIIRCHPSSRVKSAICNRRYDTADGTKPNILFQSTFRPFVGSFLRYAAVQARPPRYDRPKCHEIYDLRLACTKRCHLCVHRYLPHSPLLFAFLSTYRLSLSRVFPCRTRFAGSRERENWSRAIGGEIEGWAFCVTRKSIRKISNVSNFPDYIEGKCWNLITRILNFKSTWLKCVFNFNICVRIILSLNIKNCKFERNIWEARKY